MNWLSVYRRCRSKFEACRTHAADASVALCLILARSLLEPAAYGC